jgi:sugar phosphate isomerase/epimerase
VRPRLINADWNFWPEGHAPEAIWSLSAKLGFDGIELGVYDPTEQLSDALVETYRGLAEEQALTVETVLYSMPPTRWPDGGLADPAIAPKAIEAALTTARVASEAFGCHVLGIWPGADVLTRGTDIATAWTTLVGSFRSLAERVADLGMEVAVEYKPHELLANVDAALRLCDAVDHPALGVLVDTGHALWVGEDLPIVLHKVGDRLKHVHLGDTPGAFEADLPPGWHHDFTSFMAAIDEIGYDGAMSLDMYGAVDQGVLGSEEASRFGLDTMVAAANRARTGLTR